MSYRGEKYVFLDCHVISATLSLEGRRDVILTKWFTRECEQSTPEKIKPLFAEKRCLSTTLTHTIFL